MERIELALAANGGAYSDALILTAASVARFASRDVVLRFHILDGGLDFDRLVSTVGRMHPHVEFDRLVVDERRLSTLPNFHGSWMPYARLLLPELLPDVEFVIYCDVDFLWMADVVELWRQKVSGKMIQSTRDGFPPSEENERRWCESHGYVFPVGRYFCSGLCLFDLNKCRAVGFRGEVFGFLAKHPDIMLPDQTAMNVLYRDNVHLFQKQWQQFPRMLNPKEFGLPVVLHFAGEAPWKISHTTHMVTDAQLLWFRWRATVFGTSLWKSLRSAYSAHQIVLWRMLFLAIMITPLTYAGFALFMRCRGAGRFRERIAFGQFRRLMRTLG